jgi:hypothetical protein
VNNEVKYFLYISKQNIEGMSGLSYQSECKKRMMIFRKELLSKKEPTLKGL